jgi:DNA repair protein RecO (recombination protein O)
MLRIEGEPAFLLHARAYRETSLLLDALSPSHGRIGLVARGVRGPKAASRRALLQPFQPLHLSWQQRGELGQLRGFEAAGAPLRLGGEGLLAGFYLNELCLKLLPRAEAQPALFLRYVQALAAAESGPGLGWALRCFERELLATCGYGLEIAAVAEAPGDYYRYEPEQGLRRAAETDPEALSVEALRALSGEAEPAPALQATIRRLLRRQLDRLLGGQELHSRQLLRDYRAEPPSP